MDAVEHHGPAPRPIRPMPPVTELGAAAMACIAAGVIFTSAYLPKQAPLAVPIVLAFVAAALMVTGVFLLSRVRGFAWWRFRQVAGWGLLAYVVIGGMIEYAFIYDDTRGSVLVVLTAMLTLFVLDVTLLIGFTTARFQDVDER